MKAFLKRDIAKKLGKSPKVVQTWTDLGLVNPDLIPSQGKGISRVYSSLNLLQFAFCDELLKCKGMNLAAIKWIMDQLRSEARDEESFSKAVEKNAQGELLFTGDFNHPESFKMGRVNGQDWPLDHFSVSPAYYTINLSKVIENAKERV